MTVAEEAHTCPQCARDFKSKSALSGHIKRDHEDDPLVAVRAAIPGAPRPGGAFRTDQPLKAAPSGVPSVDYAIGIGGVPRGTLVEIFGPPAAGKTFVALTFSAFAQQKGERAGFMDAERALQPTFAKLVPGLDLETLEYGQPPGDGSGEEALETSRQFINSGLFGVWTIDSVHACTPRSMLGRPIGDPNTRAALAQLMSQGCQVLEHVISPTNTVGIFINHVKAKPGVTFGRDWAKPGGSAFDYYCACQLHVTAGQSFTNKQGVRIGHTVKVKVHKSKVAAPFQKAEFDLFYAEGTVAATKAEGTKPARPARDVTTGIDLPSSWMSVLKESGAIVSGGGRYGLASTGEAIGATPDVLKALEDPTSDLSKLAHGIVYPEKYQTD